MPFTAITYQEPVSWRTLRLTRLHLLTDADEQIYIVSWASLRFTSALLAHSINARQFTSLAMRQKTQPVVRTQNCTIRYDTIRYDTIRCDAMRCDAMRCDAMRCDTIRYDTIRYATIRYDTIRYDAMRCDAMRCDAMRCGTIRYDTIRYDAMRWDAMRCDAMRYDTIRYAAAIANYFRRTGKCPSFENSTSLPQSAIFTRITMLAIGQCDVTFWWWRTPTDYENELLLTPNAILSYWKKIKSVKYQRIWKRHMFDYILQ